ncbi:MAG: hypothetical protein IKK69_05185 [Firmicutes bacterium]|nr:hypothetical protein [Bacillota bacterium]
MANNENIWNISREAVDEINKLERSLTASMETMDRAFISLNNCFVCKVDGLGIYCDDIKETLNNIKKYNEESKESIGNLMQRMEQYRNRISMELSKRGL